MINNGQIVICVGRKSRVSGKDLGGFMNWKNLFKSYILGRGYDYYINNAVGDIEYEDSIITATVIGTEKYKVEITVNDEQITEMYCSCPYAADGKNCKHMAAVLYEWSAKYENETQEYTIESALFGPVYDVRDNSNRMSAIEILIDNADEEDIKTFIMAALKDDEKLTRLFYNIVNKQITSSNIGIYIRQVDNIVDSYGEYIDYNKAYDFVSELEDILDTAAYRLIENDNCMEAFELTNYVFEMLGKIEIDDSNGEIVYLADKISNIWSDILARVSADEKRNIFEWFIACLDNTDMELLEEYVENIIVEEFKEKEYLQSKLKLYEDMIEQSKLIAYQSSRNYSIGKWAVIYLDLLKETDISVAQLKNECKKYWDSYEVRQYYVDICIDNKDYENALRVLDESLLIDKEYRGLVSECNLKKKNIYLLMGDKVAYIDQLWKIFVEYKDGNLELFKELKQQYTTEEWEFQREQIFAKLSNSIHIADYYKEEKQYYRLLIYVTDYPGLNMLQKYEDVLGKDYSPQILEKYYFELNDMAVRGCNRKEYRKLVSQLRRMKQFEDGKKQVEKIVSEWRTKYKHRPAMMDELSEM